MKIISCAMVLCIFSTVAEFDVQVERNQQARLPIALVLIKPIGRELRDVGTTVGDDLATTGQFAITRAEQALPNGTSAIKQWAQKGIALAVYLLAPHKGEVEWRVYDTMSAHMVSGKLVGRGDLSLVHWAHRIADQIWPVLTSEVGPFSSAIVACKRINTKHGHRHASHLYAMSPTYGADGTEQSVLVGDSMNFAPRWHPTKPQLFFSQHAPLNVTLRAIDDNKRHRLITSFDGQNMTPAISKNGRVVISLSRGADAHLYEYVFDKKARRGRFERLTRGVGQYISPSFIDNNRMVFCYIAPSRRPQIGMLNTVNKEIEWLPTDGHAVAPCAAPDGRRISYSQNAGGQLQVFVYDCSTKKHKQMTRSIGHKDESCWSPCGNYLVYSVEQGPSSRIALLHIPTSATRYITPPGEHWSFPSWSPVYKNRIPFVG